MTDAETSPDVCYRHPTRESWVLCQRCGRTICPECQILSPTGVLCPECVRETGGSVSWRSAGEARRPAAKARPARAARSRPERAALSGGFLGALGQMLRPGNEVPVLSWGTVGVVLVFGVVGLVTGGLPYVVLVAAPPFALEAWRYFTAAFVYPPNAVFLISILLSSVFFLLTAPVVERNLGRGRFAVMLLVAGGVGSAAMVIAGGPSYGLSGLLFGMFGSYLIYVWSYPAARVQILVIIGINLLISLAFGGFFLPLIIGGLIGGAGMTYLFQRYEGKPGTPPRTPYLIGGAVVAVFILFAILRSIAF
ncbi:rhomboid family intramembrane serine protease [Pseudolysinimonas yzui]|uniref:Rhomboid family intramembrane serine protease n=1 Tax=Pseudolysinimonas yzui TaxID=2708254 RepID=A0A8J3M1G9_9MICO|nr:rhomboid family intramembrane serine protease [Pseudolysinimonas yzui]GHF21362.1 rhomboid family intramembrane serine protease [Pseudolysinimonas yzui]